MLSSRSEARGRVRKSWEVGKGMCIKNIILRSLRSAGTSKVASAAATIFSDAAVVAQLVLRWSCVGKNSVFTPSQRHITIVDHNELYQKT